MTAARLALPRVAAWDAGDWGRRVALLGTAGLLVYLVLLPLGFLLYGSLSSGDPGQLAPLSLDTYRDVFSSPRTYALISTSVVYAVGASLISFVFGTLVAWLVLRTDLPARGAFTAIALFPLFLPTVLTAMGWLLLLDGNAGLVNRVLMQALHVDRPPFDVNTLWGMIWVRGVMDIPLVMLWLWPALMAMDPSLEEAAAMARAGAFTVVRTITLPLVLPALAGTFLISFVASVEDVTVPIFIGLPAHVNVFASEIYLATIRVPSDVHAASVYAVALLILTAALTLVYRQLTRHSERYATVRGRGYRPTVIHLGATRLVWTAVLSLVLLVTVALPLFVLVWASATSFLQVPSIAGLRSLTWKWYQALLTDPMVVRGFVNTTVLGLATGLVVMALSVVVGWLVIRSRVRMRSALDVMAFLPIAVPGVVTGLSLMWLYLSLPLPVYGTLSILLIAYVTRFIPYGVRLAYAGFSQLHPELEEAAYTAGSSWSKMLRTVSLPLLGPTLAVGFIYTFVRAFRELPASLLLSSFGNEPYSVVAYNLWAAGSAGETAAYAVVAMVLLTIVVVVVQKVAGRRYLPE